MSGDQESSHTWQSHEQRGVGGAGAVDGDGGGEGEESRRGITPSPSSVSRLVHFASPATCCVRVAMTAHSLFQVKYEVYFTYITQSSQPPYGISIIIIITEEITELREVEQFAYSHTAGKGQR